MSVLCFGVACAVRVSLMCGVCVCVVSVCCVCVYVLSVVVCGCACCVCGVAVCCCLCVLCVVCSVWCVCVQCVVCVCVVCVVSVCGAAWHAEKPSVCWFKTSPCVGSKRLAKRAHLFSMCAFCRYTWKRFEPTRADVLDLHTERREEGGFSSLSSSLHPSLLSLLSLLSFVSFSLLLLSQ